MLTIVREQVVGSTLFLIFGSHTPIGLLVRVILLPQCLIIHLLSNLPIVEPSVVPPLILSVAILVVLHLKTKISVGLHMGVSKV